MPSIFLSLNSNKLIVNGALKEIDTYPVLKNSTTMVPIKIFEDYIDAKIEWHEESEIVNIRLIDIKLEERFINVIGKGNKFRQVVINSSMYDAISEYLEEREKIDTVNPYLFVGQKNKANKEPLRRNFCNRLIDKYKELCNIPNLHPHALRSFFCSNALHNAGYTIEQVANQAGHSSLNTTKGYLVTEHEDLVSLANRL